MISTHTYSSIEPPLSPDPDDWYKPRPMTEPLVLYRSVSIEELKDVIRTGVVSGGGNRFSWFDHRKYVFFADELNDLVISQGEDMIRRARIALLDHPLSDRANQLHKYYEQQAQMILAEMDADRIKYSRDDAESFGWGHDVARFKRRAFRHRSADRRKYSVLFHGLAVLQSQQDRIAIEIEKAFQEILGKFEERMTAAPYTSAVLITRLLAGGLLYSNEFGICGLGEREYGFRPGQVKATDLAEVRLMEAGQEVHRCNLLDAAALASESIQPPDSLGSAGALVQ